MTPRTLCPRFVLPSLLLLALPAVADGTLEEYQRTERFLPGNLRHHAFPADVTPHWVQKSNRFWYRRATGPRASAFSDSATATAVVREPVSFG
jgi:hypothetical protein